MLCLCHNTHTHIHTIRAHTHLYAGSWEHIRVHRHGQTTRRPSPCTGVDIHGHTDDNVHTDMIYTLVQKKTQGHPYPVTHTHSWTCNHGHTHLPDTGPGSDSPRPSPQPAPPPIAVVSPHSCPLGTGQDVQTRGLDPDSGRSAVEGVGALRQHLTPSGKPTSRPRGHGASAWGCGGWAAPRGVCLGPAP